MFKIYYNLFKAKQGMAANKDFKKNLWHNLSNRFDTLYPASIKVFWYQTLVFKVSVVAMVLLLITGSFGTYAYASSDVTSGTALYPIKAGLEQIEGATKKTPVAKAKFYLKQLKRRESEKAALKRKQQSLAAVEKQIDETEKQLEAVSKVLDTNDNNLKDSIKNRLEKRKLKLQNTVNKLEVKEENLEINTSTTSTTDDSVSTTTINQNN